MRDYTQNFLPDDVYNEIFAGFPAGLSVVLFQRTLLGASGGRRRGLDADYSAAWKLLGQAGTAKERQVFLKRLEKGAQRMPLR